MRSHQGCFEVIIHQNRKEHVSACRSVSEYKGDIIWVDKDGTKHSIDVGPASIDVAVLTRAYNHRIRGVQSAFLMIILSTNKSIYLIHTQVSSITSSMHYKIQQCNRSVWSRHCYQ